MTTPESLAAELPSMTLAEVRDRLALGDSPERIRAHARLLVDVGLLPDLPPLASSAALAFRDHDETLRPLAQQERLDRHEALRKLYERETRKLTPEDIERMLADDPAIPSPYGSADVAPTSATFAPDFNDPEAIRIQHDLGPICEGDGMVPDFDGPYDCPGCSACLKPAPIEGEAKP